MSPTWIREFLRIAAMLAIALVLGWLTGYFAGFVIAGLGAYIISHLLNLYRLDQWLTVSRHAQPPEAAGIWGEVFEHYYRLQRRNRQRKQRLAQLLREFRNSTAAMPDGTVVLNSSWQIIWSNDAAERLLALTARDAGQRIGNLVRQPEFVRYLARDSWKEPLEMVSPTDPDMHLTVHIVPYGEGQRLMLVRDTTRLHRLEQMRREFVANASHELRSPLTVITGYLEALADDPALAEDWSQPIGEMQRQASRMAGIVDDLLELSRLETGDREAAHEPVDVRGMATRLREEALAMPEGPRDIRLDLASDVRLSGTERELYSAFSNLVFNAMRYTPADGSVTLHWYRRGEQACFSVEDTGIGIAAEHIPRLTERFYRVDHSRVRSKGGTGLGLAIVKHVLNRHGGRLEVDSRPGRGSTFTCVFPAVRVLEHAA